MNIKAKLLNEFNYVTGIKEMPIQLVVSSEKDIEIAEKVDVNTVLLIKRNDDSVCFGFTQCITGLPKKCQLLKANNPLVLDVNVFEDDEDFSDFVSGEYILKTKIIVYEKKGHKFNPVELATERTVRF